MKNLVLSGLATVVILIGSVLSTVNATPIAVNGNVARQASGMQIIEVRGQHYGNRGHHYGWTRGRHNPHRRAW